MNEKLNITIYLVVTTIVLGFTTFLVSKLSDYYNHNYTVACVIANHVAFYLPEMVDRAYSTKNGTYIRLNNGNEVRFSPGTPCIIGIKENE